jgi:hypothetical protein
MLACVSLCLLVLSAPAWGQEGRGGREGRMPRMRQLSPEKAKAAWTWEAREVARALDLGADETSQLVKAYVAGRKKFGETMREAREAGAEGEQRRGWRADPELIEKHRSALQTQLSGFLSQAQAEEATRSLGLFSTQWDRMAHGVADLELGEEKTYAALAPIRKYVVHLAGVRRLDDREAMRGAMMEAREGLYDGLAAVLDEQQLTQLQESMMGRPGGRQQQARGEGRGQGRAPEPATAAAIGEPAPAFTLADSTGRSHVLADYTGKIVVLQWINPDCPVCRRVHSTGLVTAMRKRLDTITPGLPQDPQGRRARSDRPGRKGRAPLWRQANAAPVRDRCRGGPAVSGSDRRRPAWRQGGSGHQLRRQRRAADRCRRNRRPGYHAVLRVHGQVRAQVAARCRPVTGGETRFRPAAGGSAASVSASTAT